MVVSICMKHKYTQPHINLKLLTGTNPACTASLKANSTYKSHILHTAQSAITYSFARFFCLKNMASIFVATSLLGDSGKTKQPTTIASVTLLDTLLSTLLTFHCQDEIPRKVCSSKKTVEHKCF